jgi:hypothetical protein
MCRRDQRQGVRQRLLVPSSVSTIIFAHWLQTLRSRLPGKTRDVVRSGKRDGHSDQRPRIETVLRRLPGTSLNCVRAVRLIVNRRRAAPVKNWKKLSAAALSWQLPRRLNAGDEVVLAQEVLPFMARN